MKKCYAPVCLLPFIASVGWSAAPAQAAETEPETVRIELKSRPLTQSDAPGKDSREAVGADEAGHDHLFVYDVKSGELRDDIGWKGEIGKKGEVFSDKKRESSYGPAVKTLTMRRADYKAARAAFESRTADWSYEPANAAAGPPLAAGGVDAGQAALRAAAAAIVASEDNRTPKNDVPDDVADEDLPQDGLRTCLPGANCQLWARNFFSYLEYVANRREKAETLKAVEAELLATMDVSELKGILERQTEWLKGVIAAGDPVTAAQAKAYNKANDELKTALVVWQTRLASLGKPHPGVSEQDAQKLAKRLESRLLTFKSDCDDIVSKVATLTSLLQIVDNNDLMRVYKLDPLLP